MIAALHDAMPQNPFQKKNAPAITAAKSRGRHAGA
jgi:hypothetical protein